MTNGSFLQLTRKGSVGARWHFASPCSNKTTDWAQMRPTERTGHRKVLQQLVASQMETTERGPTLGADALPSLPGGLCTWAPFWVGRKGRKERTLLMVVSRRGPSYSGTWWQRKATRRTQSSFSELFVFCHNYHVLLYGSLHCQQRE